MFFPLLNNLNSKKNRESHQSPSKASKPLLSKSTSLGKKKTHDRYTNSQTDEHLSFLVSISSLFTSSTIKNGLLAWEVETLNNKAYTTEMHIKVKCNFLRIIFFYD